MGFYLVDWKPKAQVTAEVICEKLQERFTELPEFGIIRGNDRGQ